MKIIGKILFVMAIALATVAPGPIGNAQIALPSAQQTISIDSDDSDTLNATLHDIYEGAWARATEYTELQPGEMPKFPEETVYWLMRAKTMSVDYDIQYLGWDVDLFSTGTARTYALYKADAGLRIEHGVSLPVNARIEMLVTLPELLEHRHVVEGILAHEMIHYIHHMRLMNQKGWATIWPGDGHNYMAYLKYRKGYDLPTNRY